MTPYFFLWIFQILQAQCIFGEISQKTSMPNPLSFPELTRDILEKIKRATGQPLDTNRFIPILSASSINYKPFLKNSKYLKKSKNKKESGEFLVEKGGKKISENKKNDYNEISNKSKKGKESEEQEFGDFFGEEHQFLEERFFKKKHHQEGSEDGKENFKTGRNRGKYFIKKGYRDIFYRDETKKSDSFWDKLHEEGKWFHYGLRNKKKEKKESLNEEGKKSDDKKESSEWEKKESKLNKVEEKEVHRKSKKVDKNE